MCTSSVAYDQTCGKVWLTHVRWLLCGLAGSDRDSEWECST